MLDFFEKKYCDLCGSKLRYSFCNNSLKIQRNETINHKKDGCYIICDGCAALLRNKLEHRS